MDEFESGRLTIRGFRLVRELGRGQSGRVLEAVHEESGHRVAIKLLADAARQRAVDLRAEARLLEVLRDPNVVAFYDYVESPEHAAIVMELVQGSSLAALISRAGATSPQAALAVLAGSLRGLAAAHRLGIVHRDYKPANILVQPDGVSRLTDFGIAVPAGAEAGAAGTPLYMAPEQFSGGPAAPSTDVYAAAAVFYECLAGTPPYLGATYAELAHTHATTPLPLDRLPAELRPVLVRGMAKTASYRPQSADEFLAEVEVAAREAYGDGWERAGLATLATAAAGALGVAVALGAAGTAATGTGTAATTTAASTTGRTVLRAAGRRVLHTTAGKVVASVAGVALVAGAGAAVVVHQSGRPGPAPAAQVTPYTHVVRLEPVAADGTLAAGWTVDRSQSSTMPISCMVGGPEASISAYSDDIYSCAPTAADANACWSAGGTSMLCLVEPFSRKVAAYSSDEAVTGVGRPSRPVPIALTLADGTRCQIRTGGAWSAPAAQPDWVGYFSCGTDKIFSAVWGPRSAAATGGIDQSAREWTVQVGGETGPLRTVKIGTAYYVATAPAATVAALPCPTLAQIKAANAADRADGLTVTSLDTVQCAGTWAAAGVSARLTATETDEVVQVFQGVRGTWTLQPRTEACGSGRIPAKIRVLACEVG